MPDSRLISKRTGQSRGTAFLLFMLAVIVPFATGCQDKGKQAATPEKMTVAYSTAFNATLVHIAIVNGYFSQAGLDVTPQAHAFGKLAIDAVLNGKADIATAADTPVMFAVMNDKPIAILAAIQTSNKDAAIVARRDRGISQPADLKGKSIGVTRGTTSDYFIDAFLMDHGIDRKKVRLVDMAPDEMVRVINTGKIDAAVSWNPHLMQLQEMLGDKGQTFYGELLYTETFCAVAMQAFVKDHPEAIQRFLRAIFKAEAYVQEYPEETRRLVADFVKADKAILDKVWNIYDFRINLSQALIIDLEDQSRWAMKYRLTEQRKMPNYLDYIYADGLQQISPARVTLIR